MILTGNLTNYVSRSYIPFDVKCYGCRAVGSSGVPSISAASPSRSCEQKKRPFEKLVAYPWEVERDTEVSHGSQSFIAHETFVFSFDASLLPFSTNARDTTLFANYYWNLLWNLIRDKWLSVLIKYTFTEVNQAIRSNLMNVIFSDSYTRTVQSFYRNKSRLRTD